MILASRLKILQAEDREPLPIIKVILPLEAIPAMIASQSTLKVLPRTIKATSKNYQGKLTDWLSLTFPSLSKILMRIA